MLLRHCQAPQHIGPHDEHDGVCGDAGPEVLEADWDAEDAGGKLQILLFDVCARRSRAVWSKVVLESTLHLHLTSRCTHDNASPPSSRGGKYCSCSVMCEPLLVLRLIATAKATLSGGSILTMLCWSSPATAHKQHDMRA